MKGKRGRGASRGLLRFAFFRLAGSCQWRGVYRDTSREEAWKLTGANSRKGQASVARLAFEIFPYEFLDTFWVRLGRFAVFIL